MTQLNVPHYPALPLWLRVCLWGSPSAFPRAGTVESLLLHCHSWQQGGNSHTIKQESDLCHPPTQSQSRFYSRYFLVHTQGGNGIYPILDLCALNKYLTKRKFKMLTQTCALYDGMTGSLCMRDFQFWVVSCRLDPVRHGARRMLVTSECAKTLCHSKELSAVFFSMKHFLPSLKGHHVLTSTVMGVLPLVAHFSTQADLHRLIPKLQSNQIHQKLCKS